MGRGRGRRGARGTASVNGHGNAAAGCVVGTVRASVALAGAAGRYPPPLVGGKYLHRITTDRCPHIVYAQPTPIENRILEYRMTTTRAPAHLAKATRTWWRGVLDAYELEEHHVRLLTLAAEAWDRCEQARRAIDQHGLTYEDRFGAPRTRPEVAIERDSRLAFARLVRELDLDIDAPPASSRPPSLRSNRG